MILTNLHLITYNFLWYYLVSLPVCGYKLGVDHRVTMI